AKLGPDHYETLKTMLRVALDLVKLDRGAEALPLLDECMARAADEDGPTGVFWRAMCLRRQVFARSKDAAGCRQTAERWAERMERDQSGFYEAACMRAVLAAVLGATNQPDAATKEADRAMEWLRQAVAAGYDDAAHMKEDQDLDALRERKDFQKLLAELEPKA